MRIKVFLLVSVAIFLGKHFLSVFWPFLLGVNIFVILALTVFFLDRGHGLNWPIFWGTTVFFDFWSGGPFGHLSLSLLMAILIIFMIKKIMLLDSRGNFSALVWLVGFYYLYIFLHSVVRSFSGEFILPIFHLIDLVLIIFWTIIIMIVHNKNILKEWIKR